MFNYPPADAAAAGVRPPSNLQYDRLSYDNQGYEQPRGNQARSSGSAGKKSNGQDTNQNNRNRQQQPSRSVHQSSFSPYREDSDMDPREVEKHLKTQQKQAQLKYADDLKRQAEEQRQKRAMEKQLYKPSSNSADPPWLRGNPQPKTGIRYAPGYAQNQHAPQLDYSANSYPTNGYDLQRQRSMPDSYDPTRSIIARNRDQQLKDELARQIEEKRLLEQRKKLEEDRYNKRLAAEADAYDPWGKGGGGAPMKDPTGKIIADRRKLNIMAQSMNAGGGGSRGAPSPYSDPYSQSYGGNSLYGGSSQYGSLPNIAPQSNQPRSEKDEYREILAMQIEEKRRQRELEKMREREDDERARAQFEQHQAKLAQEMEAEKARHKQKQEAAIRKQEEQEAKRDGKLRTAYVQAEKTAPRNRRKDPDDGLEWWERNQKNNTGSVPGPPSAKSNSRDVPPLDSGYGRFNGKENRGYPPRSAVSSSAKSHPYTKMNEHNRNRVPLDSPPTPRKNAKPRSGAKRNEDAMRQLSAMRERLVKEQYRVKSALKRNDYDRHLFENDEDLEPTANTLLREERENLDKYVDRVETGRDFDSDSDNSPKSRRRDSKKNKAKPRKELSFSEKDYPKVDPPKINSDDDELIRTIKNARTTLMSAYPPIDKKGRLKDRKGSDDDESSPRSASERREKNRRRQKPRKSSVGSLENDHPDAIVDKYLKDRDLKPKRNKGRNDSDSD